MANKRGQGLPMNTIVIAAIALMVMIVLIIIFVNKMNEGEDTLNSCGIFANGQCYDGDSCPEGHQIVPNVKECSQGKVCCIQLKDDEEGTD
ncbi:MAG: hypothetical protein KJ709_05560 [Nanoarchaeota archaeon]|nr:hypothetical protein [Nanoarchaeota archaeon]